LTPAVLCEFNGRLPPIKVGSEINSRHRSGRCPERCHSHFENSGLIRATYYDARLVSLRKFLKQRNPRFEPPISSGNDDPISPEPVW